MYCIFVTFIVNKNYFFIGLGGGYSLYSDDRDDRRIFRSCNRRFGIFWGLFKQNPLK